MNNVNTITEAVILAGGLGTRLRNVIGEFPKPLAPVNGVPFLEILLDCLNHQGISSVYLSVGYKWELIQQAFGQRYKNMDLHYVVEETPLGTGGGIRLALDQIENDSCFVLNGDTLFDVSLRDLENFHQEKNTSCTMALKRLTEIDRYGTIELDEKNGIKAFREKEYQKEALINGGVYCLKKDALNAFTPGTRFSFETDFLTLPENRPLLSGLQFEAYFKDIGIPEDYRQFEADMKNGTFKTKT